jgi:murein lipoprotein
MAPIARHTLAPEAHEINLGIPLPAALADRAHGIQAAITRLKGYDVERVGAIGSIADNNVARVAHGRFLVLNLRQRKPRAFGPRRISRTSRLKSIVVRRGRGMEDAIHVRRGEYMRSNLPKFTTVALILVGATGLGGCATKGFVREQIATVNTRIDGMDGRLRTVEGTSGQALAQAQAAAGQAQRSADRPNQRSRRWHGAADAAAAAQATRLSAVSRTSVA